MAPLRVMIHSSDRITQQWQFCTPQILTTFDTGRMHSIKTLTKLHIGTLPGSSFNHTGKRPRQPLRRVLSSQAMKTEQVQDREHWPSTVLPLESSRNRCFPWPIIGSDMNTGEISTQTFESRTEDQLGLV